MSRLRAFVEGAGKVAAVQDVILAAMERVFGHKDYASLEAAILAPGLEGWEGRAIHLVKSQVQESFSALQADVKEIGLRYKQAYPHPNQSIEFWVDEHKKPHLRVYFCLRCGYRVTSMSLSGICCHGQPECPRCKHQVHEANCRRPAKTEPRRRRRDPA